MTGSLQTPPPTRSHGRWSQRRSHDRPTTPGPPPGPSAWRRAVAVVAAVVGAYLVLRAAVEPFVIDVGRPSTYHLDWGGPSLAGVLAVHMGPGVVALALFVRAGVRRVSGW